MKLFFKSQGSGFPLLILHGLFGSSDNWKSLADQFAKHFRVFSVDLRNHGRSPHADEMTYAAMVQDVVELMDAENLLSASVIGHSLGGRVAMNLALAHPEKVKKLVIVDVAPRAYKPHHQDILNALLGLDLPSIHNLKEADLALATALADKNLRAFLLKNLKRDDAGHYYWQCGLRELEKNQEILAHGIGRGVTCYAPTLFIRGGKSDYILPEDEALIQTIFPNSTISTIPEVGHWLHAEAPAEFYQVVNNFLNESPPP